MLKIYLLSSILLVLQPAITEAPIVEAKQEIELIQTTLPAKCLVYLEEVEKYDWDSEIMLQIANLESGCNANALNDNPVTGDYSVGLMQINLFGANAKHRPSEEWLRVPANNIAYAYELYQNGGFRHWTTYKHL